MTDPASATMATDQKTVSDDVRGILSLHEHASTSKC